MATKRKQKHDPRRVKARHSYSFAEVAELYGVHQRTVRQWRKEGLRVLDEASKPFLVMGADVRQFLIERSRRRKRPLQPGQFFCPRCRQARRSRPDAVTVEVTARRMGATARQAFIRGICDTCGQRLLLFSSDAKVHTWQAGGLLPTERQEVLTGSGDHSVITDIPRGEHSERTIEKRAD